MFQRCFTQLTRMIERMEMQEWGFALAGMILLGMVFLRGFGSRKNY
jgi:hypothetical protein